MSEISVLRGEDGAARASTDNEDGQDASLGSAFRAVRERSLWLTEVLEIEDYGLQPMADASPAKWHLAHTTWFFETFLLKPFDDAWTPVDTRYEYLFNSYYESVGAQFPRARRGDLSRPTVREVLAYREAVDAAMARLLEARGDDADVASRTVLGLHHEEQHQELLLTDLKYAFGHNPLAPPFGRATPVPPAPLAPALTFTHFDGGLVEIGRAAQATVADRDAFCFDNETPRHRVHLEPFALADRCVTAGEYLAFMADGGYEQATLWLSDGWAWLRAGGPRAPLYWREVDGAWFEYTLAGERPVDLHAPVTHVSCYEADAYARWAGARLPLEAEWEFAAERHGRADGNFVERGLLHPVAGDASAPGPRDLLGNQWEWTSSPYGPYPGYQPAAGALGEYNGKFMCNQLVLRGGSCATPRAHVRTSYRNFFYPPDRWQFTGVRLARYL